MRFIILLLFLDMAAAYWDTGTTTEGFVRTDTEPRTSFFRWQRVEFDSMKFWAPQWDWEEMANRRFLCVIAGISIDFLPLGTAVMLNRRVLITSANYVEPYINRQRDFRIWALGRSGLYNTPFRYRVWRIRRLIPRSNNPEHWHGPRGIHVPRHDVAIIHSMDQMYIFFIYPDRYMYPYRATLAGKRQLIYDFYFAGSGYEYLQHIVDNYKIFFATGSKSDIVNCETYLPKWWGKFICAKNTKGLSGVPNGGGFFTQRLLVGMGCFEVRYNEDRIMVFTDLRYYYDWIHIIGNISTYEYYEYAYPQWSVRLGWVYDGHGNVPYIPAWQYQNDLYPLGK